MNIFLGGSFGFTASVRNKVNEREAGKHLVGSSQSKKGWGGVCVKGPRKEGQEGRRADAARV